MSITQGVLAQSPEPEAHDKVLDNNPDRIGSWKCWFLRRGENRSTRRKTSRSKDENQQQTQPTSLFIVTYSVFNFSKQANMLGDMTSILL